MIIKLYAWIPRSHVHVVEIVNKVKNLEKSDIKIENLEYDDYVSFNIKSFEEYKNISFVLDSDGLYSLSVKLPEGNADKKASKFYEKARRLMMEIIKKCHKVTYSQIIEGILPINYSTIILSRREYPAKGLEKIKASGLTIYTDKKTSYSKDITSYVSGSVSSNVESICDYLAFTNIMGHFFYEMMNKMEEYHQGTKEVIRLLEFEPKSKLINNAYLNLDLVKKDAAESWAKVEQGIDSLFRKRKSFEETSFPSKLKNFINKLGLNNNFKRLNADKDYISSLWTLLINHLDYVDTAVEARVNYKSMKAYKANQWLGIINSGFILGAIMIALFMLGTGQITSIGNFIIIVISWIVAYEFVNYLVMKRNS